MAKVADTRLTRMGRPPRQSYVMSPAEFEALGGREAPEGYDPDAVERRELQGKIAHVQRDPFAINSVGSNPTDPEPGFPVVGMEQLEWLAANHGVLPLTIAWPDKYSPDFSAVPAS